MESLGLGKNDTGMILAEGNREEWIHNKGSYFFSEGGEDKGCPWPDGDRRIHVREIREEK